MQNARFAGLVLCWTLLGGGRLAFANYIFTPIDIPGSYSEFPEVLGINNRGELVGTYIDTSGVQRGFLSSGSSVTAIGTFASGINDSGQVVGFNGSFAHGFLYDSGSLIPIDYPGNVQGTVATGINDRGEIVGLYIDSRGTERGFLDIAGKFSSINYPGAADTLPYGINDSGQIVGGYIDTSLAVHGFLYSAGIFKTIDVPGAWYTTANGINDQGDIVGFYQKTGENHGFVDLSGSVSTIDYPGTTTGTSINGINVEGQLVGGYDGTQNFVATPTPEPSTLSVMVLCVIGFGAYSLRTVKAGSGRWLGKRAGSPVADGISKVSCSKATFSQQR